MTKPNIEKFATLDFEASSLSHESWPIEIGLSWLTDGEVQTWSTLDPTCSKLGAFRLVTPECCRAWHRA